MVFPVCIHIRRLSVVAILHLAAAIPLFATNQPARADEIRWLGFSTDGARLAVLTTNGNVTVFDSASGERLASWPDLARGDLAAWRPGGAELAVVRDVGEGRDIWLVRLDGPKRRLTRHPAMDCNPQWNADGSRLVFVSYRTGDADVWEMPVAESGAEPALLAGGAGDQWDARTQPRGKGVAWCEIADDMLQAAHSRADAGQSAALGTIADVGGHVWPQRLAWDISGTRLLLATGTPPGMTLWACDPDSGGRDAVATRKWVAHATLDIAAGRGAIHSSRGLETLRRETVGASWTASRVLDFEGLRLGLPALSQSRVAFAVARKGIAVWEAASDKTNLLFLNVDTHLEIARELAATGRTDAAERLCIQATQRARSPIERAEAGLCHAAVLRRAGKPEKALAMLDAVAARKEAPAEALREAMLLRAEVLLCDLARPKAAREAWGQILSASPDMDASEIPIVRLLDSGQKKPIELYARALGASTRNDAETLYEALEKLVAQRRAPLAAAAAAIELLTESRSGDVDARKWADRAARVYRGAARQLRRAPDNDKDDEAQLWLERERVERLRTLLAARDFMAARELALEIVRKHELGNLGGVDFLRYYVETDRSGRRIHALMGRVLLSAEVAEALEAELTDDPAGRCLLALARTKLALLEGEMRGARDMLARTDKVFHALPDAEFSADIARLQVYLWVFQAKYQERLGAWDAAIASYETVQSLLAKYWPDNDFLVFEVARTLAEIRAGRACPELLNEILLVERGMGDPILNPTDDETQLRLGARNLLERLRRAAPSPLDGFISFHIGRYLGRAGDAHAATHYLERAFNTGKGRPELRRAVLWEKTGLADISRNHWLRIRACQALLELALDAAQRDSVRLHLAEAKLELGRWNDALEIGREVLHSSRLESLRIRAQQVAVEAGEEKR